MHVSIVSRKHDHFGHPYQWFYIQDENGRFMGPEGDFTNTEVRQPHPRGGGILLLAKSFRTLDEARNFVHHSDGLEIDAIPGYSICPLIYEYSEETEVAILSSSYETIGELEATERRYTLQLFDVWPHEQTVEEMCDELLGEGKWTWQNHELGIVQFGDDSALNLEWTYYNWSPEKKTVIPQLGAIAMAIQEELEDSINIFHS